MLKCWSATYYVNEVITYRGQPSDQILTKLPPNHAPKHHWQLIELTPSAFYASNLVSTLLNCAFLLRVKWVFFPQLVIILLEINVDLASLFQEQNLRLSFNVTR